MTVIYRSVSTYKQARSQEVRRGGGGGGGGGGGILLKTIYPGGQIRERGGGGREIRPLAFSGPNTKSETPSGLMHSYYYHN